MTKPGTIAYNYNSGLPANSRFRIVVACVPPFSHVAHKTLDKTKPKKRRKVGEFALRYEVRRRPGIIYLHHWKLRLRVAGHLPMQ